MARVYHILAMFCILVTLTTAGLIGWMAASGALTAANREAIVGMLRGDDDSEIDDEATTQPVAEQRVPPSAAEDLAMSERAVERTQLLTRRSHEELQHKMRLMENLQRQIQQEREALTALRLQLAQEIEARNKRTNTEGFKRQLKLYQTMETEQVKDIFVDLPEDEAARYLAKMKPQVAADVMGLFQSGPERAKLQRLLKMMQDV